MKQITFTLILCFCSLTAMQAQEGTFTIHGKLTNMTDKHLLLLFNMSNDGFKIDTLKVENGAFTYTGKCRNRETRTLMLSDTEKMKESREKGKGKTTAMIGSFELSPFVHPGADIELSGDANDFPLINLKDSKNQINEDYITVKLLCAKQQKEINKLHYTINEARWNDDKETAQTNLKHVSELGEEINKIKKDWIATHPNNEYAAYLYMTTFMNGTLIDELQAQYDKFTPAVQQTEYGKAIADKIKAEKRIIAGATAPDFTMKNIYTGKDVSLADYKGKYLIIDFWGSWCGPCRASHPHLIQLYKQYKGDKFDIIGVAADRKDNVIKEAADKDGLLWPQFNMYEQRNGQEAINKLYNISAFPTKILVNPQGIIEAIYIGDTKEIDAKLKELLGK